MSPLQTLLTRWASQNLQPEAPESAHATRDAFERVGGVATKDIVELYAQVGGWGLPDNENLTIWPLSQLVAENTAPSPFGTMFADYMIFCWVFRLQMVSSDVSAVYLDRLDGTLPKKVACSLGEFLEALVSKPSKVLDLCEPKRRIDPTRICLQLRKRVTASEGGLN
jgi:hypothetical protein